MCFMSQFHIGTSGWSYDGWKGVFYPEKMKSADFLDYYCQYFDCVELNSSFYRLPSPSTIAKWKKQTPENFLFCPKLSRYITHVKKLNDVDDALKMFIRRFQSIKNKMGPILVQFPEMIKFTNPNREAFFKGLRRYYSFQFAIEVRDKSWLTEEAIGYLSDKEMAFVIADWKNGYPSSEEITSDTIYLRFHGKEYGTKYSKQELSKYAKKIERWLSDGKDVWTFFNNDACGYAVENAQTLKMMVLGH